MPKHTTGEFYEKRKKITADIENFSYDLNMDRVNIRLLYKIRSSIKGLDKETIDLADGLITSIDKYLEEDDQLRALDASLRFVGLIEGFVAIACELDGGSPRQAVEVCAGSGGVSMSRAIEMGGK